MSALQALLFAQAMTLTVSDRVELRGRRVDSEDQLDAETRPAVTLAASRDNVSWLLSYTPMVTALSLGDPGSEILVYHTAGISTTIRSRRSTLTIAESLEYGRRNFRLALGAPDTTVDPAEPTSGPDIPEPLEQPPEQAQAVDETLEFGGTTTSFTLAHALGRRLFEITAIGYTASGGLDDRSREMYPLQRSPWLTQSLGYRATRVDTLTTNADARVVFTGDDRRVDLLLLEERWSRRHGKYFATDLSGGAVLARQETAGEVEEAGAYPQATAAIHYGGRHLDVTASTAVTAVADRTSGAVDQRALWAVGVGWPVGNAAFSLGATGGRSLDMESEGALETLVFNAGVGYRVNAYVSADGGVTSSKTRYVEQDTTTILWTGYVGVTFRAEPIEF